MSKDLTIGYFGDGPWAHRSLEMLLERDWDIAFIAVRHGQPDAALERRAERLGVPCVKEPDVNDPAVMERFARYGGDLYVSMSFDQIIRRPLREIPQHGFINCHAGALPFYRGRHVLNWVLINGENRFGVTVHYMDDGVDTGDIIKQRFADIGEDDAYPDLLERAYELCASTLTDAIEDVRCGEVERTPQHEIHPVGFYCGRRRAGDEALDWRWTARRVHDFVRGLAVPGPAARAWLEGRQVAILQTALIEGAPEYVSTPGEVVGRDAEGVTVKAGDTVLRVTFCAEVSADGMLGEAGRPEWPLGARLLGGPERAIEELRERIDALEARI